MIVGSDEPKIVLTPEQADELMLPGPRVHNFILGPLRTLFGCDCDREDALEELRSAHLIELGGPVTQALKHPIVVWRTKSDCSFFEADMAKVKAFEESSASGEVNSGDNA